MSKETFKQRLLRKLKEPSIDIPKEEISPSKIEENLQSKSKDYLPDFFQQIKDTDEQGLQAKLREEARSLFLTQKSKLNLDSNELKSLWNLLEKKSTSTFKEEKFISYDAYLKVKELAESKTKRFLSAQTFIRLLTISSNQPEISIVQLFNYVMRKIWLDQTRTGLSFYENPPGEGFIKEQELEHYIEELLPTLLLSEGFQQSFHNFYVCTVLRKFFFFLDPLRTGKIRIRDILTSGFLDDLLELRDDELPKDVQELNWFSAPSALRVYALYLNLDRNHNGMLSKSELAQYGSGTLTTPFLDRVFAECLTYDGEMDYKTYLDFVLALEHRSEPPALAYLFRILDIDHTGKLTKFTLNYFFKGIQEQIKKHNAELVNFEDVLNEIFDMVKPNRSPDDNTISLKELINCGQGATVVSILIEWHKFFQYENREAWCLNNEIDETHTPPPPSSDDL